MGKGELWHLLNKFRVICVLWFVYCVKDVAGSVHSSSLSVFTRTPEALYGVSHIYVSPTHPLNDRQHYKACWSVYIVST